MPPRNWFRRRPRSIRSWLTKLLLACILPAFAGAGFLVVQSYQQQRRDLQSAHIGMARALMQAVDGELSGSSAVLQVLATSSLIPSGDFPRWALRYMCTFALMIGAKMSVRYGMIVGLVITGVVIADTSQAQNSARNRYRQMGSIAAAAETCYGSAAIPEKLLAGMRLTGAPKNFSAAPALKDLVAEYNDAYSRAIVGMTVSKSGNLSANSKTFDCTDDWDIKSIRKLETSFLGNMR